MPQGQEGFCGTWHAVCRLLQLGIVPTVEAICQASSLQDGMVRGAMFYLLSRAGMTHVESEALFALLAAERWNDALAAVASAPGAHCARSCVKGAERSFDIHHLAALPNRTAEQNIELAAKRGKHSALSCVKGAERSFDIHHLAALLNRTDEQNIELAAKRGKHSARSCVKGAERSFDIHHLAALLNRTDEHNIELAAKRGKHSALSCVKGAARLYDIHHLAALPNRTAEQNIELAAKRSEAGKVTATRKQKCKEKAAAASGVGLLKCPACFSQCDPAQLEGGLASHKVPTGIEVVPGLEMANFKGQWCVRKGQKTGVHIALMDARRKEKQKRSAPAGGPTAA